MPQHENKDHREERKKVKEQEYRNETRIIDARSESRKDFLTPKFKDPRIKLQELPITQAKDRRQKLFEQNRAISKTTKEKEEKRNPKI